MSFSKLAILALVIIIAESRIKDQYCGINNCYTLLGVEKDATPQEIKKAFRAKSLEYHPDRNPETAEFYKEINRAYEILGNNDLRAAYDEFLNNPDTNEYLQYYKFYKAKYAPQSDPRLVVFLCLSLFSFFQYVSRRNMYKSVLEQIEKSIQFQHKVNERMEELKQENPKNKINKSDVAEEIKKQISVHGGYSPPELKDLLLFKFILFPISFSKYIYWYVRWIVLFTIMKKPYGADERSYLTRQILGVSETKWVQEFMFNNFKKIMEDDQKDSLIVLELWIPKNLAEYTKANQEKSREMYADSAKYKRYQRYMKKNG